MNDTETAIDFLLRSATERRPQGQSSALNRDKLKRSAIDLHGEFRTVYESRRREMEAAVLEEFGMYLAKSANIREAG